MRKEGHKSGSVPKKGVTPPPFDGGKKVEEEKAKEEGRKIRWTFPARKEDAKCR